MTNPYAQRGLRQHTYTVTHDGSPWWDFKYRVEREGRYVGMTMTRWGAKLLVKRDRKQQARGEHVVWEGQR